ncbi:MAG: hypothetical protein JKY30_14510 [Flavobacteriales bacterium]|nr:hypothetical protein [Flavobacteriales bacterium]
MSTFRFVSKNKTYSSESIHHLAKVIDGEDESYDWLNSNQFKELAAFHDVFVNQNKTALAWLKKYDFDYLINFYFTLIGNMDAQQHLINYSEKEWYFTVAASVGEHKAFDWLIDNEFKHFGFLAMILNKEFSSSFNTLGAIGGFGGSIGSTGGSGGFGGFGGGSFGGGGAGGSW